MRKEYGDEYTKKTINYIKKEKSLKTENKMSDTMILGHKAA